MSGKTRRHRQLSKRVRTRRKALAHVYASRDRGDAERRRDILDEYGEDATACARKRGYTTRPEAEMIAARAETRSGKAIRVYRCPRCGMFHLTSQPRLAS